MYEYTPLDEADIDALLDEFAGESLELDTDGEQVVEEAIRILYQADNPKPWEGTRQKIQDSAKATIERMDENLKQLAIGTVALGCLAGVGFVKFGAIYFCGRVQNNRKH